MEDRHCVRYPIGGIEVSEKPKLKTWSLTCGWHLVHFRGSGSRCGGRVRWSLWAKGSGLLRAVRARCGHWRPKFSFRPAGPERIRQIALAALMLSLLQVAVSAGMNAQAAKYAEIAVNQGATFGIFLHLDGSLR